MAHSQSVVSVASTAVLIVVGLVGFASCQLSTVVVSLVLCCCNDSAKHDEDQGFALPCAEVSASPYME